MRVIRCDRCGSESITTGVGYIAWNWRDTKNDDLLCANPFEDMDYCEDCMAEIREFVSQRKEREK